MGNRTIEFRAWHKEYRSMCSVLSITFENKWSVVAPSAFLIDDNGTPGELFPDEYTLEQDTGSKDKNGNKIFEGDTVKTWNGNVASISYNNGFFRIGKSGRIIREHEFETFEIIGNIHEDKK